MAVFSSFMSLNLMTLGFEPALFCLKIGISRYALLFVGVCRIHDCTRFISIDRSLLHKPQTVCNGYRHEYGFSYKSDIIDNFSYRFIIKENHTRFFPFLCGVFGAR